MIEINLSIIFFIVPSSVTLFRDLSHIYKIMDKLKELLKATKPTTKLVEQKKVIEEQNKKYEEEHREEQLKKQENRQKRLKEVEDFFEYQIRRKKIKPNEELEETIIGIDEVKSRLRALHQPITLFAQTERERYQRMLKIENFCKQNPSFDMKTYDEQFQQRLKEQEEFTDLDAKYRDRLIEPRLGDDPKFIQKKTQMILKDQEEVSFENMCDEIFLWLHKVIRDWNQALEQKYHSEELKERYKDNWNRFYQSSADVRSFSLVLKKRGGDQDMIRSVYHIMNCCLVRQYIQANDKYIDLSIGNAPWPLGVAMLSITVRRNGPKVSHVLNDESSRKWMQTIKRLITVSQEMYPSHEDYKRVGYSVKPTI